jgi:hypothetical protein
MSLLPKKTTPQEWIDVPLFGDIDPAPATPQRSKKQDADAAGVKWKRRPKTAKQVSCQDCVEEHPKGLRQGIGIASYVRTEGQDERYLCFHHRAEYGFREDLAKSE